LVVEVERDEAQRVLSLQPRLGRDRLRDDRIEPLRLFLPEPFGSVEGRLDGYPRHVGFVPAEGCAETDVS